MTVQSAGSHRLLVMGQGYVGFPLAIRAGGRCLPVGPSYLSWQVRRSLGRAFRFVELANDRNEHVPDYPFVADTSVPPGARRAELTAAAVSVVDAVVVRTDHDVFDLGLLAGAPLVLDTRHAVPNVEYL